MALGCTTVLLSEVFWMDESCITCMYSSTTCSLSICCQFFSQLSVLLTGSVIGILVLEYSTTGPSIVAFDTKVPRQYVGAGTIVPGTGVLYFILRVHSSREPASTTHAKISEHGLCATRANHAHHAKGERRHGTGTTVQMRAEMCALPSVSKLGRSETCVTVWSVDWAGLGWRSS